MGLQVNIKKKYKGFSLHVNFQSAGQTLGILGASGSGKSITLQCIAGLITPDAGSITLNGRVLYSSAKKINLPPRQRKVGYLFQNYALFPHMTVQQNIACAFLNTSQTAQELPTLLQQFQLQGLQTHYPSQLSGGQQQRVALARILASKPEALLLDEPFSALDAHLKELLQVEMANLLVQYTGNAIMVTHSRDEIYRLCPSLLVIDNGQNLAQGNTKQMFANPGHLQVAKLTGCKNISRAQATPTGQIYAQDWDLTLQAPSPIPANLTHIGIRAHNFTPCSSTCPNAIATSGCKMVESPFEWNLLFQNKNTAKNTSFLWWKLDKTHTHPTMPAYLQVLPQHILLLSSEEA